MGTFTDHIDERLRAVIEEQPVFFVATATAASRVNVSPKGMDTLRVLDERTIAYLDLTGSGNETATHLAHDGRMTVMLCRFDRKPDIIRLYGRGRVVTRDAAAWSDLAARFPPEPGLRQFIVLDVESVQSSCGYAVPRMEFVEHRTSLRRWADAKDDDELRAYWAERNATSIDGLAAPDPTA